MKLRFKLIAVVLVAVLVIGIYHLGVRNNETAKEDQSNSYYKTENIYVWYSDDRLTDFFTTAAVAFHEKNKGIRVIPKLVKADEYIEYINSETVKGEDFPDLFLVTNDSLEKAYLAGLASETKDSANVLNTEHFSQTALNAVTYDEKLVAYPLYFETTVLVYNKTYLQNWLDKVKEEGLNKEEDGDIFEEELDETSEVTDTAKEDLGGYDVETLTLEDLIPASIEDVRNFADEYDAPDGVDGVFKWDVSDIFYNYFFVGNYMTVGGECGDDLSQFSIYSTDTMKCMNVYQNLNQFFSIDAETSTYDGMIEDFIKGKFVYSIATSDVITRLENAEKEARQQYEEEQIKLAGNIKDWTAQVQAGAMTQDEMDAAVKKAEGEFTPTFQFGYARVPMLSDELLSRSLSVTDVLTVNGYSEHKVAANAFAAFASTEYSDHIYSKTSKIAASTDANYEDETLKLFQEEYSHSIPLTKLIGASDFWVQLEATFTEIWGGGDVESLLQALAEKTVNQFMESEHLEKQTEDNTK